jgi:signal transduction histidine kinase/Na+/proline symporter
LTAIVIIASLSYLIVLFAIAYWAERRARQGRSVVNNPYIYALSLAVYCTAWTYYGSVGRAATQGLDFILIYLGPTLMMPLWWFLTRKIIHICKVHHISNIADFISSRYGKSAWLGGIVTMVAVLGVIPYISLQLRAITNSFTILVEENLLAHNKTPSFFLNDYSFYIAISLAVFTIYFGTRNIETTEKNEGMVAGIAFESIFKLVAFLLAGVFVSFYLFDGFGDIFRQAGTRKDLESLFVLSADNSSDWFYMLLVSALAFVFLPRQFQMAVVENKESRHLDKALWLFPLYLLLINIFVLPIALGGRLLFEGQAVHADHYVLTIPMSQDQTLLTLVVYLGGFAAATSMIIVASLALSMMLTNNLLIPLAVRIPAFKQYYKQDLGRSVIMLRRMSIVLVLLLSYGYLHTLPARFALVSIGLVSFVAVAQFAPSFIGGIYWKNATKFGAKLSLLTGFGIWAYTLIFPTLIEAGLFSKTILSEGPWGIAWLHPQRLLGLDSLSPIAHVTFWSLSGNMTAYVLGSVFSVQSSKEHNQALLFVDVFEHSKSYEEVIAWKGKARKADLENLVANFLGQVRSKELFRQFELAQNGGLKNPAVASAKWVNFTEKVLAGAIGAASARIIVSTVVKEEEMSKEEVIALLKESQEIKKMNQELTQLDKQKNDFISTVTHEMRTPITSIRAFAEILHDHPDLDAEEKEQFLNTIIKETERMNRLIDQVLELERFESGKSQLHLQECDLNALLQEAYDTMKQVCKEKNIEVSLQLQADLPVLMADTDRLMQVLLNLLSNAVKFCDTEQGHIWLKTQRKLDELQVSITNNGQIIPQAMQGLIFDKFYQTEDQTVKKPKGSGLGLAICKRIIALHHGGIWVESSPEQPTTFHFTLPIHL